MVEADSVVIAIDCGTTSARAIAFDSTCHIVAVKQQEYPLHFPKPGWAEHVPTECWKAVSDCVVGVKNSIQSAKIMAVGITNHRESVLVWDSTTGKPLHNTLLWLDTRTFETRQKILEALGESGRDEVRRRCGLPIETYFSALKLRWLYDHIPEVKKAMDNGTAMVGTVDCWLVYELTGHKSYVTDVSNASRTMLLNLDTCQWDPWLIKAFGLPATMQLPRVASSSEIYGTVSTIKELSGVPIGGILGDQQAALVGQGCLEVGSTKNTYGTGCFLLLNTGTEVIRSTSGLLTTVAYQLGPKEPVHYAMEGSIAIAGAAVQWLRDKLGIISTSAEVNDLAMKVPDSGGVVFVPAFSGLFAPYWRPDARGVIIGLTQYSSKHHIARAALESVAFQTREVIDAIVADTGRTITSLRVDGGMTNSDLMMQIQADILGVPVVRPAMRETTALGAAFVAGRAVNFWKSKQDIIDATDMVPTHEFKPLWTDATRRKSYCIWKRAVQRTLDWTAPTEDEVEQ